MNLNDLVPLVIVFIVAAIVAGFGSSITANFGQSQCEDGGYTWENDQCWTSYNATSGCTTNTVGCTEQATSAYNASQNTLEGIDNLTGQLPNLGLVVIAALIVGVLLTAFGSSMGRR